MLTKSFHPIASLDEVLRALAERVEIPADWEDQIDTCTRATASDSDTTLTRALQVGLLANSIKASYRRWQAAARLHYGLTEFHDQAIRWCNWKATGLPARLNTEEQKRAMTVLVSLAQASERRVNAYLAGQMLPHEPSHYDDGKWVECLGFDRNELIALLDQLEIPHRDKNNNEGAPDTVPDADTRDSITKQHIRKKLKRDTLDTPIDRAIEIAGDDQHTADVWLALKKLALDGEDPFTGGIGHDGSLAFNKSAYVDGAEKIGYFTLNALDAGKLSTTPISVDKRHAPSISVRVIFSLVANRYRPLRVRQIDPC